MPQQRKLPPEVTKEAVKMLDLKANKKLLQQHLSEVTGNVVLLKDLHNVNKHNHTRNDFQELIEEMKRVEGMWRTIFSVIFLPFHAC